MSAPRCHAGTLFDILPPTGGYMAVFEFFADASGTSEPCKSLSVASFLYEKTASQQLDSDWCRILEPFLAHLPKKKRFFHMTKFMAHAEPYGKLNDAEWRSLRHDLIEAATKNLEFAAVCNVVIAEYNKVIPEGDSRRPVLGGPFSMCGMWALDAVSEHLGKEKRIGDVAYAFEAGDPDQDELEERLSVVPRSSYFTEKYRYAGHTFIPKTDHHALGAADMLAWEYRVGVLNYLKQPDVYESGPFFMQLFNAPVGAMHFSEHNLQMRGMSVMIQRANDWARQREEAHGSTIEQNGGVE